MSSFQITVTPSARAAGRFVSQVRRAIQKALAEEEKKRGITQSDIARAIGVNRSVISREIRGHKDITLGRVGELAWALRRKPLFDLLEVAFPDHSNLTHSNSGVATTSNSVDDLTVTISKPSLTGFRAQVLDDVLPDADDTPSTDEPRNIVKEMELA